MVHRHSFYLPRNGLNYVEKCLSVCVIYTLNLSGNRGRKGNLMQLRTCRAFIFFIGITRTYVEDRQVNKQTVQIRPLKALQEFKAA